MGPEVNECHKPGSEIYSKIKYQLSINRNTMSGQSQTQNKAQ